ncbi:MAG: PspC domain-containing protein [Desulfobacterales bacterium]|nr:MAG: PspC domain-containing protein [Desulfobacterales bacterium]
MKRYHRISPRGIYRSRQGAILGVCRGLAEHFDFSLFWTRVLALIFFLCTGFWPAIGLYLVAALLMKPEPEPVSHGGPTHFRPGATDGLKRKFADLEGRMRRMEDRVAARK